MSVPLNQAKLWRFLVTDQMSRSITLFDRRATARELIFKLGDYSQAKGSVSSDDPYVNLGYSDGQPYLEEGVRFLYGFRREDDGTFIWRCRFAGKIEQLEDSAESDDASSSFIAYDPWRYMLSRMAKGFQPVIDTTQLVGSEGHIYSAGQWTPVEIFKDQVARIAGFQQGLPAYNPGQLNQFYLNQGSFSANNPISFDFVVQQGESLGEVLQNLMQAGVCDIQVVPLYDPLSNPGILGSITIVTKAGTYQPTTAIFSYDLPGRSLSGLSKLKDGTKRVNRLRYYGGKSGAPLPTGEDTNSQAVYGIYEEEQFFPGVIQPVAYAAAANTAALIVAFRKAGQITITIKPVPERAPRPFQDYFLGDWGPVYWSNNVREAQSLVQRFMGITIELDDNALETVTELLVVVSDEDQPQGAQGGPPAIGAGGVGSLGIMGGTAAGLGSTARSRRLGTTTGFTSPTRRGP